MSNGIKIGETAKRTITIEVEITRRERGKFTYSSKIGNHIKCLEGDVFISDEALDDFEQYEEKFDVVDLVLNQIHEVVVDELAVDGEPLDVDPMVV